MRGVEAPFVANVEGGCGLVAEANESEDKRVGTRIGHASRRVLSLILEVRRFILQLTDIIGYVPGVLVRLSF